MAQSHRMRIACLVIILLTALIFGTPAAEASSLAFATCNNLILNGDFEAISSWALGASPIPAQYVSSPVHSGSRAMQLGNIGLANQLSFSSIRQTVTIPANVTSAQISFWVWAQSEPNAGSDRQELLFLVPGSSPQSAPVAILWRGLFNNSAWTQIVIDVSAHIGQTFDVYFNVFNDGVGGRTAMVIDDVALNACSNGGPTITPTLTPTPTSSPGVNISWVGNLTPSASFPQTRDTSQALFVTVEVYAAGVTEPPGQGAGIICFLHFGQVSSFGGAWSNITDLPMSYVGDAGNNDRYGVNMGPLPVGLYEYTAWCSGNGGVDKFFALPGGASNNGRLTVIPLAGPTVTPTPTSVPIPTIPPYPTPPPGACTDIIANGGFEWDGGWILGRTAYSPAYAGAPNPVHSGLRSMRLGKPSPSSPNVPSFSSVQQQVTIPHSAQTARISFWYFPGSTAAPGGLNRQELILLSPWGQTEQILWRVTENANTWLRGEFDLTPYRGRTIVIYFNARNAGDGSTTTMFLDDVELLVCHSVYPIPYANPQVYPTAGYQQVYPTAGYQQVYPTAGYQQVYPTAGYQQVYPTAGYQQVYPTVDASSAAVAGAVVPQFTTIAVETITATPVFQSTATPTASPGPGEIVDAATQTPTPAPTPTATSRPPDSNPTETSDILNMVGPWAVLCMLGVIVLIVIAVLSQVLGSRGPSG